MSRDAALPWCRAQAAARLRLRSGLTHTALALALIAALWLGRLLVVPVDVAALSRTLWWAQAGGVVLLAVVCGVAAGWWRAPRTPLAVADALEQAVPAARNLLRTATELEGDAGRTPPEVVALVMMQANSCAATIDVAACWPVARAWQQLAGTTLLLLGAAAGVPHLPPAAATRTVRALAAAATGAVTVTRLTVQLTPPAYTQQPRRTLVDPARIEVLAGTTVHLDIDARADSLVIATIDSSQTLAMPTTGHLTVMLPVTTDGYVAVEPRAIDGRRGARQLLGVSVRTDQLPQVRLVAPAQDQRLTDIPASLTVRMDAQDDLGLTTLRLRTTKVSGSGERFTFQEDERPVTIARASTRVWSGTSTVPLAALLTEPGDVVVLRATTSDARPGAPAVESDAVLIERTADGGVAATGIAMDPDEERTAVSQQMVILKTEQLIARRTRLADTVVQADAAQLAAEQRRVRAEFVFMMGGEFAQDVPLGEDATTLDEQHEAESESDLAAGRMVNRGRQALLGAVRAMSRAAVALTSADLTAALASEKLALTQLQQAFARSRFLMRALSEREQLDPTRRLTGKLDSIARTALPVPSADREAQRRALQGVVRDLLATALPSGTAPDPSVYALLAERVLQADPTTPATQQIATQLTTLGRTRAGRESARLRDQIATALTQRVQGLMRPATPGDLAPVWRDFQAQRGRTP